MPKRIGPYRIERTLGQGGMGIVYAARDERLGRRVALKQLRPDRRDSNRGDKRARRRFRREAHAIAQLDHPAIVQIHDLLETPDGDWIVLQYVEGPNLAEQLSRGPLTPAQVISLARDIASALDAAHSQGFLHRDLKAENVILTPSGAKVLDFGLAKFYQPLNLDSGVDSEVTWHSSSAMERATFEVAGTSLTRGIAGTCRSMSPEQANGYELDPRSDLFSLGVLLYEAATGVSPFLGASAFETMTRVCTYQQPLAHKVVPSVPLRLAQVIDQLMMKDPARRPASAAQLLQRLDPKQWQGVEAATKPIAVIRTEPLPREPLRGVQPVEPRPPRAERPKAASRWSTWMLSSRSSTKSVAIVVVLVLMAIVLTFWLTRSLLTPSSSVSENDASLGSAAPLYVLVQAPLLEQKDAAKSDEARLARAALQAGLLRALAATRGVIAITPDSPPEGLTLPEIARFHSVDEVLTSSLDCGTETCLILLRRQKGSDGQIVDVQSFEAPLQALRLIAIGSPVHVEALYPEFEQAIQAGLDVAPAEYADYLRLWLQWDDLIPTDVEPMLQELRAIRSRTPGFVEPYILEARILHRRFFETRSSEDLETAMQLLRHAQSVPSAQRETNIVLFYLALDSGRLEVAKESYAELRRLFPGDVELLELEAKLAAARGQGDLALLKMREAVRLHPSGGFQMSLAQMEMRQGNIEVARATLEATLASFPGWLRVERRLAQLELQSGSPARAAELYEQLLERRRGFTELSNLGLAHLLLQDWPKAAHYLQQAHELAPNSAHATLNLADAKDLAGEDAEALYLQVLQLASQDAAQAHWQTLSVRAQALAHLGRDAEAVRTLQQALILAPDDPQLAFEAALVYVLLGESTSALASAERAVQNGFERRWFALPYFDSVRGRSEWREILADRPR